jgi:hypothetical protein
MKKLMVGLMTLALALAASAKAETITLGPDGCGIIKQCLDIPNDAGLAINLYGAPQYQWFYVYLTDDAGVTTNYYAPVASGLVMDNVVMESFYFPDPLDPTNKVFTGQYITVSGTFSTYRTCTRSGRGQHCSTHYNLNSGGTIVR